jgi:DNA-binding transcriptional regulator YiaG
MDLGLSQAAVALRLGVCPETVLHWELGRTIPGALHLGRITEFLGYYPLDSVPIADFPGRVLEVRRRLGLTQRALARCLGVSEDAVRDWERGRHKPQAGTKTRLRELAKPAERHGRS